MRNALGLALLALPLSLALAACGDNIADGTSIDAALVDAPVDAAIDARVCPVPAQGMVGGTCTTNAQCDSATGAGDGFCFNNLLGVAPWPAPGHCLSRNGGRLAMVGATVIWIAAGHMLGGPERGNRATLAVAASVRHPGIAIALAGANFDDRHVQAAILLYLLVGLIIGIFYGVWLKLTAAAAA